MWDQAPGSTYPPLQWIEGRGGQEEEEAAAGAVRVGVEGGDAFVGVVAGRTVQSPSTTLNIVCGVVIEKVGFFKSLVVSLPWSKASPNSKHQARIPNPEP